MTSVVSPKPSESVTALASTGPLVQCITNTVVTNFTANVLLAAGASPAMCDIPGEAGDFAAVANGLLVNLGTPTSEQREASREAVAAARQSGTPWVLDPVAVGSLRVRTELAQELLEKRPTLVRGNPSEILALAGAGAGGRGVDTQDSPEAALASAVRLARRVGCVVAVSGERDLVTDGRRVAEIRGGSALLTRVTGAGCSLGAVMAAFAGVTAALTEETPASGELASHTSRGAFEAAVAASALFAAASERAVAEDPGPGTFAVRLLDALAWFADTLGDGPEADPAAASRLDDRVTVLDVPAAGSVEPDPAAPGETR